MAEKLMQHRHCRVCEKAIPAAEEYCNEECKDKWNQMIKANKKKFWVTILWMVLFMIFAIVLMSAFR